MNWFETAMYITGVVVWGAAAILVILIASGRVGIRTEGGDDA